MSRKIVGEKDARKDKPEPTWATWALLEASKESVGYGQEALVLCRDRLDHLSREQDIAFVVLAATGHWGRGTNLDAAARACVTAGCQRSARVSLSMVLNDPMPHVSHAGSIIANAKASVYTIGVVRTLGSLIIK